MKIVRTQSYMRALRKLGASEGEIEALEAQLAGNPEAGDVIPGLRGIRKIRFAMAGRGKRGGGRAIYYVVWADAEIAMLFAYSKTEREDLTPAEKRLLLRLLEELT